MTLRSHRIALCGVAAIAALALRAAPAAALQVNNAGATGITATAAWMRADLVSTNGSTNPVNLRLCWGTSDGTTNFAYWGYTNRVITGSTTGAVGTNVTGLIATTRYYYRWHVTEGTNTAWASPSTSFWTIASLPTSTPPTTAYTPVMADSNGVVVSPTNLSIIGGQTVDVDVVIAGGVDLAAAIDDHTNLVVSGDNLGNHTATSDVNVAQNSLTNVYQVRSGGASDPVMSFWYDRNGTMYEALQFGNDTDGYGIQVITNSQHSGFYGADGGVLLDWQNQTLWGWGPTLWNAMDANITAVSNVAVNVATNSLSHGNWGFTIPDPTNATWNFVEVYPDYAGVATGVCWKSMGYSAGYIGYVANSHTSRVDNHGAVLQQLWSTGGVETCFSLTNAHTADGVYHLVFTNCATATNIVGKIRY